MDQPKTYSTIKLVASKLLYEVWKYCAYVYLSKHIPCTQIERINFSIVDTNGTLLVSNRVVIVVVIGKVAQQQQKQAKYERFLH